MAKSILERFMSKVSFVHDGCWTWLGSPNQSGYGRASIGRGRTAKAHRVAYELFIAPIPDGAHILHKCGNGHLGCVNPLHLYAGTIFDNKRDALRSPRPRRTKRGMPYGAVPNHKRFAAIITVNYKRHYFGTYDTAEEASAVACSKRDEAMRDW